MHMMHFKPVEALVTSVICTNGLNYMHKLTRRAVYQNLQFIIF